MNKPIAMRDALLNNIHLKMDDDKRIFFVTADFGSPVLDRIRADFPDRFVNVGIAEQNLINISSGLALEGYKVFAYAIAPFITMRCFEQLRVNLALLSEVRDLNVNLIGVGAGYSYVVSGPTHQCYEDISLIRSLPNFKFYSPSDQHLAGSFIDYCLDQSGPKYLRFDAQPLAALREKIDSKSWAKGFEKLRNGDDGCLLATGYMTHTAMSVAETLSDKFNLTVIDLFNLSDFDRDALVSNLGEYKQIFSLEEGFSNRGGLDAIMYELLGEIRLQQNFCGIGVKPGYNFELGTRQELHELVGIGHNAVCSKIIEKLTT